MLKTSIIWQLDSPTNNTWQ